MSGTRPGYLINRKLVINRSFHRALDQRFESYWTNPYGTKSHEGYHILWITALFWALCRKVGAEISYWQSQQPDRTWRIP